MANGALRKRFIAIGSAIATAVAFSAAIGMSAPASAQLYSDAYEFLQAVDDKDGTAVTELLDTPGSTVVNARDLSSGQTGMHIVVARRDRVWIDFLYQQGANVNVRNNEGITPLMLAVQLGFVDGVEALIAHGAQVDVTDNSGETPLMSAVHSRNTEMMRLLLVAGADPDRYDNSGRSARDYARLRGENDITNDVIARHERPVEERASTGTSYGPSF